jgi:putative methionine-R-sulfoxide reductase with GAF domain
MVLPADTAKPRRRDYEKILSILETRWKRRPADHAKIMQDIADALWDAFGGKIISWCGFYLITSDGQPSVLGPHQDKVAVAGGIRDICRRATAERKTQVASDTRTERDPAARREIAIPIMDPDGGVFAVLHVCSEHDAAFGEEDRRWLERIVRILEQAPTEG